MSFLIMNLKPLCPLNDLEEHKLTLYEIEEEEILVVRTPERVFAFENNCNHADKPLLKGKWNKESYEITCPFHKAVFSLKEQGAVKVGPAIFPLRVFETFVKPHETTSEPYVYIDISCS
jgi:nitrite reductase/ring-hydroxylating ferredoxin subunit